MWEWNRVSGTDKMSTGYFTANTTNTLVIAVRNENLVLQNAVNEERQHKESLKQTLLSTTDQLNYTEENHFIQELNLEEK